MTTFYSNHFSAAVGGTGHFTTLGPVTLGTNMKHARKRVNVARLVVPSGQDLGSGDIIRVMDLRSSDCVGDILASMDADWGATTTFDIGLYQKVPNNAGVAVDADLFATAVDWSGAIARTSYWKESTTLTDMDRWKPLYTLIGAGAAYTVDPMQVWTLAFTTTQDISATAAAVEMMVEVEYIAGV